MFNEKAKEYDVETRQELPVFQMPKYKVSKSQAIKLIQETGYVEESDFWILMNRSRAKDKMLYNGLIISHNGCLKINDKAESGKKFKPECVTIDKEGYNDSLVYTYICPEQGIYEVGEVSKKNCKNEYPYAMAFKRCFDRVVLKLCGLAFYGVYSDSEADEFKEPMETKEEKPLEQITPKEFVEIIEKYPVCSDCGKKLEPLKVKSGELTPHEVEYRTIQEYGRALCVECAKKAKARIEAVKKNEGR